MSRGPTWTPAENEFLTGILQTHGDRPRGWSEEVKAMVKARLASRTESGIYQQTLKIIKSRKVETMPDNPFTLARGA